MNLGIEDENQEFKESLSQLDKGLKSLVAMLNRHGQGTVYFGVSDDGNVCGLVIGKDTYMDIRDKISRKIEPRIYAEIKELVDEDGKQYIKVSANGYDIPYSCDGKYYIRCVSADEKLSNDMLRKMLINSDTDIIRQKLSPVQDLTFNSLFAILSGTGIHPRPTKEFYYSYGLLNREEKFNVNAYLLSDENNISIKVVVFDGVDKTVMSKRTEYGGKCLLSSVREVLEFFEAINVTTVKLNGAKRIEVSLFDQQSFREAWINACLHNDWNGGIAPSVYMYDDRIEIVSYGSLPFDLSMEGFYTGKSRPVNKSLLISFNAAKFSEQSGHGVPTIVNRYGRDVFSFEDGMVRVSIPLAFERAEVTARKSLALLKRSLTDNQKRVYDILADNGKMSIEEVAEKAEISLSGAKKIFLKLQEYGILERKGSKRDGIWIVK